MIQSFSILEKDRVLYDVDIEGLKVTLTSYTDKLSDKQFTSDNPTIEDVVDWFETRCFPRTRANLQKYLERLGLKHYSSYDIVQKTRGLMWDDFTWIRWKGEDISYDQIKIRE